MRQVLHLLIFPTPKIIHKKYKSPKASPAEYFLSRIECHRKARDQKVSKCEAYEEVVIDASQLGIENDAEDDEEVGEDGDDNDEYQDYPLDDGGEVQVEMTQLTVGCIF